MPRTYCKKSDYTLDKQLPKSKKYMLDDLYLYADTVEARAYALGAGWNEENFKLYDEARAKLFAVANDILRQTDIVVRFKSVKVTNNRAHREVYWYKISDRPADNFNKRDLIKL